MIIVSILRLSLLKFLNKNLSFKVEHAGRYNLYSIYCFGSIISTTSSAYSATAAENTMSSNYRLQYSSRVSS